MIGVIVALVVLAVAAGAIIALVGGRDHDADSTGGHLGQTALDNITTSTSPVTTAVVPPPPRVPVDPGGGLSWTMAVAPTKSQATLNSADGKPIPETLWVAEDLSNGQDKGDIVGILELSGSLSMGLDAGLRGAVKGDNGEVLEGPSAVTLGGHPGRMVTATFNIAGNMGTARFADAQFGDRVLIVGTITVGPDSKAGQQRFADLVASVRST